MKWKEQGIYNYAGIKPEGQGGGGELGPNTVGSDEIINDSVKDEDLNKSVRDRLNEGFATSEDIAQIFEKDA